MKTLEEIKSMFGNDRFVKLAGIVIDSISPDAAVCSMDIKDDHLNAMDNPQGGAIYTLADFAFAVAANSSGNPTVTLNGTIHYMSASKGKRLIAAASAKSSGKRVCVYEVLVTDETGAKIAFCSFAGYVTGNN